ncbi:hypothetical protein ACEPAI_1408 [Sanghuangporus weigelae]
MSSPSAILGNPTVEVAHLFAVRYLTLSGFTVLLYDIALTLGEEVEIIWSSGRWTILKIAYLLNRYGASFLAMFYLAFLMPIFKGTDDWCVFFTNLK